MDDHKIFFLALPIFVLAGVILYHIWRITPHQVFAIIGVVWLVSMI